MAVAGHISAPRANILIGENLMAIVLDRPSSGSAGNTTAGWRLVLAALALLTLVAGIGLSGGFSLPAQPGKITAAAPTSAAERPAFDGRGKWTGYAR
jgi:hypothetical protein